MKLLELFSGTKSVGKVAKEMGWDVICLDMNPKTNPDIVGDVLEWNYKVLEVGHFDVIWASPPCTEYSIAKTVGERNLELADSIAMKTLEIIHHLKPK